MYQALFNGVFRRIDPETSHRMAMVLLRIAGAVPPLRMCLKAYFTRGYSAGLTLFGRELTGPLGMAAGFDKNAQAVRALDMLGFAFVEVGTVTPRPQPGNARPRSWRILDRQALRNAMGFNNQGSLRVARRLRRLRRSATGRDLVIGVNLGKNKVTPPSDAPQDYRLGAQRLAPYADYLVVNVSSPNTPGLRDLQSVEHLRPILRAAQTGARQGLAAVGRGNGRGGQVSDVPLLVKISPDLADEDIIAVALLVEELKLAGVVAVNTTIDHDLGGGGLSGPPLLERGLAVVRLLRAHLSQERLIMGVGGISTGDDVHAYLEAGAGVTQAMTAFIYQGPAWPGRMQRGS